jgi:acyl-CoA thioesterase-1
MKSKRDGFVRWKLLFIMMIEMTTMNSSVQAKTAEDATRVVLFGGSSVFTSYLPESTKHHIVLAEQLKMAYPQQKIEVANWADNGEYIARYLLKGAYERQIRMQPGIDVAIIRFGTNDQKRMKEPEYYQQMLKFLTLLKNDFPGVAIILETGIYMDFPKHYTFDRNLALDPYWEVSRKIAAQFDYPLVDYYAVAKQEAAAGNWDIRVRKLGKEFILDAGHDEGRDHDPKWFTDIHPNPVGVRLAVREEIRVLKNVFPEKLPAGQKAVKREPRDGDYYSQYLNFPAERLVTASNNGNLETDLQEATR